MKLEDKWLIGVIIFCILFTASFGWGLWALAHMKYHYSQCCFT